MKSIIGIHEPYFVGKEKKYVIDCLNSGWVSSSGKYCAFPWKNTNPRPITITIFLNTCFIQTTIKSNDFNHGFSNVNTAQLFCTSDSENCKPV